MPAPPGAAIAGLIKANAAGFSTHPSWLKFVDAFSAELSTKWQSWTQGAQFGQLTVIGAGVGAWTGVGVGGQIRTQAITLDPAAIISAAGFPGHPALEKFIKNSSKVIDQKFNAWSKSFLFAGASYVGTSGATPLSPGPFNAVIIPTPLIALGTGTNPSGIGSSIDGKLASSEDGDAFQTSHPLCKVKVFTAAFGAGIEQAFQTIFLTTTLGNANSVTGTGAPAGVGTASSKNDGKLV